MFTQSDGPLAPQTILLPACFPELDCSILTPGAVQLAIGRETHRPYRAVMTFLDFYSALALPRVEIE